MGHRYGSVPTVLSQDSGSDTVSMNLSVGDVPSMEDRIRADMLRGMVHDVEGISDVTQVRMLTIVAVTEMNRLLQARRDENAPSQLSANQKLENLDIITDLLEIQERRINPTEGPSTARILGRKRRAEVLLDSEVSTRVDGPQKKQ